MAEYDDIDRRVRSLEIWRGEMGSVKGDVQACDIAIHGHRDQLQKLERRMDDAEKLATSLDGRITKNEAAASWIGNWKQRLQGITSTLAVLYVGIELLAPGSIAKAFRALGTVLTGGGSP